MFVFFPGASLDIQQTTNTILLQVDITYIDEQIRAKKELQQQQEEQEKTIGNLFCLIL
jgi:hypothetical protein